MKQFLQKSVQTVKTVVVMTVDAVEHYGKKALAIVGIGTAAEVATGNAHATGSSFPDITTVASDAATLIASLIALGVTILAWKLGSRWIRGIVK
jgi:hypothetical protein